MQERQGQERFGQERKRRLGMERRGLAGLGNTRQAGHGAAWCGEVRKGKAGEERRASSGPARYGAVGKAGRAGSGMAWRGQEMQATKRIKMDIKTDITKARLIELRTIEKKNGGVLQPEHVVEFAEDPNTALHGAFEWDNDEAANQYRLEQARRLIRVIVEVEPRTGKEMRAFVALKEERYEDGGYRHMPTLMANPKGRESVLETALWELEAFQKKYAELKELAALFAEIRKLKTRAA